MAFFRHCEDFQRTFASAIADDMDVDGVDAESVIEDHFEAARDGFLCVGLEACKGIAECCAKYINHFAEDLLFKDKW